MIMGRRVVWVMCGAWISLAGCNKGGDNSAKTGGDGCASANFKNEAAKFCLTLPAGFKAGPVEKDQQAFDGPNAERFVISWAAPGPGEVGPESVESLAAAGKIVEKGDISGGKGKFAVYDEKNNPTRYIEAIAKGTTMNIRCTTNGPLVGVSGGVAACKSLYAQ